MRIKDGLSTTGIGQQGKNPPAVKSGAGSLFAAELTNRRTDITTYEQEVENLRHEIEMVATDWRRNRPCQTSSAFANS